MPSEKCSPIFLLSKSCAKQEKGKKRNRQQRHQSSKEQHEFQRNKQANKNDYMMNKKTENMKRFP